MVMLGGGIVMFTGIDTDVHSHHYSHIALSKTVADDTLADGAAS